MDAHEQAAVADFFVRMKKAKAVAKAKGAKFNTIATVAQAAHESAWGTSWLAQGANNLFGVKATTAQIKDGFALALPTREWRGYGWTKEVAYFARYPSWNEAIVAYAELVASLSWFKLCLPHADPPDGDGDSLAWLQGLEEPGWPGWATDPAYVTEVSQLFAGVQSWLA